MKLNLRNLNPRWTIKKANTTGPATNYLVQQGGPLSPQDWKNMLDCDVLFSFEIGHWPDSAAGWAARWRNWPRQEVRQFKGNSSLLQHAV